MPLVPHHHALTILGCCLSLCLVWPANVAASGDTLAKSRMKDPPSAKLSVSPDDDDGRFIFSITLHTADEIDAMLSRAETLAHRVNTQDQQSQLALVLHGSEIDIFAKKNYSRYRKLVERAAKLDAEQVIEIKACATQMRALNLEQEDLPAFIEIVPYGPDEEQRLRKNGYVDL